MNLWVPLQWHCCLRTVFVVFASFTSIRKSMPNHLQISLRNCLTITHFTCLMIDKAISLNVIIPIRYDTIVGIFRKTTQKHTLRSNYGSFVWPNAKWTEWKPMKRWLDTILDLLQIQLYLKQKRRQCQLNKAKTYSWLHFTESMLHANWNSIDLRNMW